MNGSRNMPAPSLLGSPTYAARGRASSNLDCFARSAASSASIVDIHPVVRTTSPAHAARVAIWFDERRLAAVHAPYPPSNTRTLASPAHRRVHQAREACAPPELSYTTTILSPQIPQARAFACNAKISGKGRLPDASVGLPEKSV